MEVLDRQRHIMFEMSKLAGGVVSLGELIQNMVEALVNEIMDVQTGAMCAEGNRKNSC